MATVVLDRISKTYQSGGGQVEALRDIDFTLEEGEFAALCGPSGSGKSSLLNIIGCLDKPSGGTISILGKPVLDMDDGSLSDLRGRSIGFIFQAFNLIPVLTVFENIEYPLLLTGVRAQERHARIGEMIESLGLGGMADHGQAQLSGGQQATGSRWAGADYPAQGGSGRRTNGQPGFQHRSEDYRTYAEFARPAWIDIAVLHARSSFALLSRPNLSSQRRPHFAAGRGNRKCGECCSI